MLRSLRLWGFVIPVFLLVTAAELTQALAEGWLVPQEQQMHALVNESRTQRGLPSLPSNDALQTLARRQAQAMSAAGYIFHTSDLAQQALSANIPWTLLGENVGVGPDVVSVQNAFLNSPTHLKNVVELRFNALGVGATADTRGAMFFTQDFGALRAAAAAPVQTTAQASGTPVPAPAVTQRPAVTPRPRPVEVRSETAVPPPVAPTPVATVVPAPAVRSVVDDATPSPAARAVEEPDGTQLGKRPGLLRSLGAMLSRFLAKIAIWA